MFEWVIFSCLFPPLPSSSFSKGFKAVHPSVLVRLQCSVFLQSNPGFVCHRGVVQTQTEPGSPGLKS